MKGCLYVCRIIQHIWMRSSVLKRKRSPSAGVKRVMEEKDENGLEETA